MYGYFLASKPVHDGVERHIAILAPFVNAVVVNKGEAMPAIAGKGIKALVTDGTAELGIRKLTTPLSPVGR